MFMPVGKSFVYIPLAHGYGYMPSCVALPVVTLLLLSMFPLLITLCCDNYEDICMKTTIGILVLDLVILIVGFILTCMGIIS